MASAKPRVEIKNTLKFSFPAGSFASLSLPEMANFVFAFDADPATIQACYYDVSAQSLLLKFQSEEAMENALQQNSNLHTFRFMNGRRAQLRMSIAGVMMRNVLINNLPPEVPDSCVVEVLGEYGTVKSLEHQVLPNPELCHITTGARMVIMEIRQEIPGALEFAGYNGTVACDVRRKLKCFRCKLDGHLKTNCPQKPGNVRRSIPFVPIPLMPLLPPVKRPLVSSTNIIGCADPLGKRRTQ